MSELEATIEKGVAVVSEVPAGDVMASLNDPDSPISRMEHTFRRALATWAEDVHPSSRHQRGIFNRDKYVTPSKIFEQMGMAYDAFDDDIIGAVADTSESMTFQKISFEAREKDDEDIWNQIGKDLDLDTWVRTAWRELFAVSQFYGVRWWGKKTYRVRGKGEKRSRRKEYDLVVPTALGFLDPTRIVPVGADLFGNAQLAWIASDLDMKLIKSDDSDQLVSSIMMEKYEPTEAEKQVLENEDIDSDSLVLLNPMYVWRHTLTKSPFERWARIRMKSVFPILDLKHQLREMDRAFLLGGINFIVLVTRGSDTMPTTKTEVADTATQVRTQSRSPIIVSDHRIKIEIITPDVEHILNTSKWSVLDERIMLRLWGTFQFPSQSPSRETSVTIARVIARGLQSRRHMLKRSIEKTIIDQVTYHPANQDKFAEPAKIEFTPRRIELELDPAVVAIIQELRDRGDLSRETVLNEFNFDQAIEALRREYEDERYKDVFAPVNVPFDSPSKTTPSGSGKKSSGNKQQKEGNDG